MAKKYESLNKKNGIIFDQECGLLNEIEKLACNKVVKRKCFQTFKKWAFNLEVCSGCGEGGELLCCDRCPASFHLMCHDPPLYAEKIPKGKWVCRRCQAETTLNPKAPKYVKKNYNSDFERDQVAITTVLESIKNSVSNESSSKPIENIENICAASIAVNPKQYSLPLDVNTIDACELPFDEINVRKTVEFKPCYYCKKVSDGMLSCDFCQIFFHLDCLDPPLTSTPKERWMCPLHVEPILDQYFVNSLSVTDRVKIWKQHARQQDLDYFSIALDFCRKNRFTITNKNKKSKKILNITDNSNQTKMFLEDNEPASTSNFAICTSNENSENKPELAINSDALMVAKDALCNKTKKNFTQKYSQSQKSTLNDEVFFKNSKNLQKKIQSTFDVGENVRRAYRLGADSMFIRSCSDTNNSLEFLAAISKIRRQRLQENNILLNTLGDEAEENETKLNDLKLPKIMNNKEIEKTITTEFDEVEALLNLKNESTYVNKITQFDSIGKPIFACLKALPPFESELIPIHETLTRIGTSIFSTINSRRICRVCKYLGYEHAIIFFDKSKQRFEIVTVAPNLIVVNGVFYGQISNNNLNIQNTETCSCVFGLRSINSITPASKSIVIGNGSVIEMGCIKFVFATSEYVPLSR